MASHVVVIDSTLRRAVVKTGPRTHIIEILEKGCEKLGVKADKYILKHNKRVIDMTQTFEQSGLSSGAKLELVQASRSPAPVSVALQLPESLANGTPNGRLTSAFSSATTFWMILRKFESDEGRNLNLTGRGVAQTQQGMTGAGRIFYEQPVCHVGPSRLELSSITELQKSLASLGFNGGTCLIRLSFRVTGTPLEEAMAEITQYFKSVEEPSKPKAQAAPPSSAEPATESTETVQEAVDDIQQPDTSNITGLREIAQEALGSAQTSTAPTNIDPDSPMPDTTSEPSQEVPNTTPQSSTPATTSGTVLGPGNRKITVFSAPTDSTPRAALQQSDDSEFEPTLAHIKLHENRIKGESRNKRLPTAAEEQKLAEEKAAKQATIKSVEVKFRFPDEHSVSARFEDTDTAKDLYECARGMLREEISGEDFILTWRGDKGKRNVPKDGAEKLIVDLGFVGRTLVNFEWQQGVSDEVKKGTTLKAEYVKSAQPVQVPDVPVVEEDTKEDGANGKTKGTETSGDKKPAGKGIPKWLKLGKK